MILLDVLTAELDEDDVELTVDGFVEDELLLLLDVLTDVLSVVLTVELDVVLTVDSKITHVKELI